MRKLAMTMVAAAALVWAQGARADDAAKERREAADATRDQMKQGAHDTKASADRAADRTREEGREAKGSADDQMHRAQDRHAAAGKDEKRHSMFDGKDNFDVKGKVARVSQDSLTIQRDALPDATLKVTSETKIELNGDRATLAQLKPGADVKASFNLKNDKAEAVEIKADRKDADKR
jgi:hypothetical protein